MKKQYPVAKDKISTTIFKDALHPTKLWLKLYLWPLDMGCTHQIGQTR